MNYETLQIGKEKLPKMQFFINLMNIACKNKQERDIFY